MTSGDVRARIELDMGPLMEKLVERAIEEVFNEVLVEYVRRVMEKLEEGDGDPGPRRGD